MLPYSSFNPTRPEVVEPTVRVVFNPDSPLLVPVKAELREQTVYCHSSAVGKALFVGLNQKGNLARLRPLHCNQQESK